MNQHRQRRQILPSLLCNTVLALAPLVVFGHETHHGDEHAGESPTSVDQLIDAAFVAQSQHRFQQALDLTRQALTNQPHNDQAWLLLASVNLVRGKTSEAAQACDRLRHATLLVNMTCRARVALAMNDFAHSKQQLDALLSILDDNQTRNDSLAWSLSVAGDLAVATGDNGQAIDYYSRSLHLADNAQVRAALTDTFIRDDRLEEAAHVLDIGAHALPLQIRRMIVARRLGHAAEFSAEIKYMDRDFRSWIEAKDWQHAREMARFYLDVVDRPALARHLAVINFELQKEPEDFRLLERTSYRQASLERTTHE